MENQIVNKIQELKLNQKEEVLYKKVRFTIENKKRKLIIKPKSTLLFDIIFYAVSVIAVYYLILSGNEIAIYIAFFYAFTLSLQFLVEMLSGYSLKNLIYNMMNKKIINEFMVNFSNINFKENL